MTIYLLDPLKFDHLAARGCQEFLPVSASRPMVSYALASISASSTKGESQSDDTQQDGKWKSPHWQSSNPPAEDYKRGRCEMVGD
jgi:hypothetical protein